MPAHNFLDIRGRKFGRLRAIRRYSTDFLGHTFWLCRCNCGHKAVVKGDNLHSGNTKSCGCLRGENHGMSCTPEYQSWIGMKARCCNPKSTQYPYYGARGIRICDRWLNSFENFYKDMGKCPKGKTLDRIDNDRGYMPGNCRWATWKQQIHNRRKFRMHEVDGRLA